MSVNDASRIIIDGSKVMASLSDESSGIIYDCIMFIVQDTDGIIYKYIQHNNHWLKKYILGFKSFIG